MRKLTLSLAVCLLALISASCRHRPIMRATATTSGITTIQSTDRVSDSRVVLNNNFAWLNSNKAATGTCAAGYFGVQTTTSGLVCLQVSYANLIDVPTTFAPAAHQHGAGDIITGLLPLVRGGTNNGTWIAGRCVQVSADGTKIESAASACGSGAAADAVTGATALTTAGRLPYITEAGALGQSGVTYDTTTNNIAIGTTMPAGAPAGSLAVPGKVYAGGTALAAASFVTAISGNNITITGGVYGTGATRTMMPGGSISSPTGTGTLRLYLQPNETQIHVALGDGVTAGTLSRIVSDGAGSQFPADSTPLASCEVVLDAVQSCTSWLAAQARDIVQCGRGLECADSGGKTVVSASSLSPVSAGVGSWWPFDPRSVAVSTFALTANRTYAVEVYLPFPMTINRFAFQVTEGSGTCSGTCGLRFSLWSADRQTKMWDSGVLISGGTPDINTIGAKVVATVAATLPSGFYYLAYATDSTALRILMSEAYGAYGIMNLEYTYSNYVFGARRVGYGTASTGAGASLAFPAILGTLSDATPDATIIPIMGFWQE
jgi:hypothetical protein